MGRIAQLEAENANLRFLLTSAENLAKHWEANCRNETKKKRNLHVRYDRLFRRSLRGRWLRLKKRFR